jgi:hypothetical protein
VTLAVGEIEARQLRVFERLDDIWQGAGAVLVLERHSAAQAEEIRDLQRVLGASLKAACK